MTNVQHQIQADRSGKIWINVNSNDPRLNINGIVARIRPVYNHNCFITTEGTFVLNRDGSRSTTINDIHSKM